MNFLKVHLTRVCLFGRQIDLSNQPGDKNSTLYRYYTGKKSASIHLNIFCTNEFYMFNSVFREFINCWYEKMITPNRCKIIKLVECQLIVRKTHITGKMKFGVDNLALYKKKTRNIIKTLNQNVQHISFIVHFGCFIYSCFFGYTFRFVIQRNNFPMDKIHSMDQNTLHRAFPFTESIFMCVSTSKP